MKKERIFLIYVKMNVGLIRWILIRQLVLILHILKVLQEKKNGMFFTRILKRGELTIYIEDLEENLCFSDLSIL